MTPEQRLLWTRHVAQAWRELNRDQFHRQLSPPTLEIQGTSNRLGLWIPRERCIRLSERLFTDHDWFAVLEVLRHEMAHQYVSEVLGETEETAHGHCFRYVCEQFGIDARASGAPKPSAEHERLMARIRSLLALAASPNEFEAQAAARKAYALMHRHNVTLTPTPEDQYEARRIGPEKSRFQAHEKVLAGILGAHFFVRPIYVPTFDMATGAELKTLEVSGRPDNLAMADHVYNWLEATGERLFKEFKRERGLTGNGERRRFLLGIVQGFSRQLHDQKRVCEETGLVWVGDPGLNTFVGKRHPRLRTSRSTKFYATDAYREGLQRGAKLDLHRPIQSGPSGSPRQITRRDA